VSKSPMRLEKGMSRTLCEETRREPPKNGCQKRIIKLEKGKGEEAAHLARSGTGKRIKINENRVDFRVNVTKRPPPGAVGNPRRKEGLNNVLAALRGKQMVGQKEPKKRNWKTDCFETRVDAEGRAGEGTNGACVKRDEPLPSPESRRK